MSQKEQILHALRAAGSRGVSNGELNRMGIFRYSARILELRHAGHVIRTVTGKGGLARFYLDTEPASPSPPEQHGSPTGGGEQAALFTPPPSAYDPYGEAA